MSLLCCSSSLAGKVPPLWCGAKIHLQAQFCGFFLLTAVCLKTSFSPLPVFLSLCCSLRCCLDHFISGTGYCPFQDSERFVHMLPAVRSFLAKTAKELTLRSFGLPVSSHPRKEAAMVCASLRRTEAPWALGSFISFTQAAASGAVCSP